MALFAVSAAMGAASSGYNAFKQQTEIETQTCALIASMQKYSGQMTAMKSTLDQENAQVQTQIGDMMFQISGVQQSIRNKRTEFKATYRNWCIGAAIFMILLIFIFVTKIVILKASTTR